jgi:hypothetical protein
MDEEIKKLVEENLKLTQEIYVMTKKMKRYITFQKVMSFIYFLLIVVPIILSIIYLPPLINNMLGQYGGLLGTEGLNIESLLKGGLPSGVNLNNVDLKNLNTNSLSPAAQKELQKIINNNPNLKNIDINKLSPELQKEAQKYLNK